MGEMFGTKRYATKGVANEIALDIQLVLWSLIDARKKTGKIDYLQIFELTIENRNGIKVQKIIHRQEVPPIKDEYMVNIAEPIDTKIWVIDSDSQYCTMMYPFEY